MSVELDKTYLAAEATVVGHDHGWTHANYVDAYGSGAGTTPEVPAAYRDVPTYYLAAFAEGVERYESRQHADGTPCDWA